ncbi:hypothetical protein MLD38_031608 [Melastoma candidum]|uniref:Uncharacterized protein n=1 Tax=Melastoma candidum TaxID=119954 RepID=A0ACB9MQ76_9MYRT|nr:hypothetical protein MLD38_031608 [Melastoma candidum]
MAASKLLTFGTAFLRYRSKAAGVASAFTVKSLRLCTATTVDNVDLSISASTDRRHPWPEWVSFIDELRSKGYFRLPTTSEDKELISVGAEDDGDHADIYTTLNLLKEPCLSFARDRFDILRSLSTNDIRTVVKHGCPNLLRKAVNSGKRLRVYVQVDEADACSGCNLRGSCDRAYVMLKDSEDARTVDIVRTLLSYALDPLVISGDPKPPGRELVESSVRKLLMELIKLSETPPDPELLKPAVYTPRPRKGLTRIGDGDTIEEVADKRGSSLVNANDADVEMKRGDWMCSKCNFLNFSKNLRCLRCKEDGPMRVHTNDFEVKKGDWICQKCDFMNFSRNSKCLKCRAEGPKGAGIYEVVKKKFDWDCPKCEFMNFASNKNCLRCKEPRPKRALRPGDWECASCDYLNYSRNEVCLKCKAERPQGTVPEYEEQLWKSPY